MRSLPHPMRVVWKTSQIVMFASITALVLMALASGPRTDNGADVLVPLAWLVIASFLVMALTARRAGLQPPVIRMWPASSSVVIARPPEEVWAFIRPPETSSLINPKVRRAFTVPGTPLGTGEQQCHISETPLGVLHAGVIEVVDEQPGRSARVVNVTGPRFDQYYDVAPSAKGTRLTYDIEISAARWGFYNIHPRHQAERMTWDYVTAVKRVIESQPPGQPPTGQGPNPSPTDPPAPADSTDPSSRPRDDST